MRKLILSVFIVISCVAMIHGMTILFIGDSITDGNWGSPSKYPCSSEERNLHDSNHILGHGFVEMTAGYFMGEYPDKKFRFINRGISGETLFQISDRWDKDALSFNPDIISLLCGTNDIHYWLERCPYDSTESYYTKFDYKGYAQKLDSLISATKEVLPSVKIFLCTPFVGKAGWAGEAANFELRKNSVDSIAAITREIARAHFSDSVYLVDFNELKDTLLKENDETAYWIWDGIHPTTAMHHRMSKEWIKIASQSSAF